MCQAYGSTVSTAAGIEHGRERMTFRCDMAAVVLLAEGIDILVGASPLTAYSVYSTGTVSPEKD